MRQDPIWQAFAQTGDPLYYLLYRSIQRQAETKQDGEQTSSRNAAVRI